MNNHISLILSFTSHMDQAAASSSYINDDKQQTLINAVTEVLQEFPAHKQLYQLSCKERIAQKPQSSQQVSRTAGKQSYYLDNALQKYQRLQEQAAKDVKGIYHVERLKASVKTSELRKTLFEGQNVPLTHQKDYSYDVTALAFSNEVLLSGLCLPELPTKHITDEEFKALSAKRAFFTQQMKKKAEELLNKMSLENWQNENEEFETHEKSDLQKNDLECETKAQENVEQK